MAGRRDRRGPGQLRVGYLQCVGGVSGDMLLGAIVDAGAPLEDLRSRLLGLAIDGFSISASKARRGGVEGTLLSVNVAASRRFDTAAELIAAVEASDIERPVTARARAVLERLADAEAAAHGGPGDAHLHELGSADTLIDVVGAVVGLDMLGVERLYSSPLPTGSGLFASGHGPLPAPSPATTALFRTSGAPTVPPPGGAVDAGEMVTPTGAAIVTTLAEFEQPAMTVSQSGYGLGARDPAAYPNVVALRVGDAEEPVGASTLSLVETNIDDMSAELFPYTAELLFELGARDVWLTPIQMKKGRPGTMLSALVDPNLESRAIALVLRETSTLGVRIRRVERYEADRSVATIETSLGAASVKVKRLDGRNVSVSPEYEDCRRIAREKGMPIRQVYRVVESEAAAKLLHPSPEGPPRE